MIENKGRGGKYSDNQILNFISSEIVTKNQILVFGLTSIRNSKYLAA